MKVSFIKSQVFSVVFTILFLLQSCSVYQNKVVSLDEASQSNSKVLVQKVSNKKLYFKKIEKLDSIYYGIKKSKGQLVKIPLDKNEIKAIAILDKKGTLYTNIGIFISLLGVSGIGYHFLQ